MTSKNLIFVCLLFVSMTALLCAAGCQDAAEMGAIACEGLEGEDRDHCIQQLAVASGNLEMCEDIESAGPKSKCWLYIIADSQNPAYCNAMVKQDWYGKQGAYDINECFQYVARELDDPDICRYIAKDYTDTFGSDLNPGGVSQKICLDSIQCGHTGQKPCYSFSQTDDDKKYSCVSEDGTQLYYSTPPDTCP